MDSRAVSHYIEEERNRAKDDHGRNEQEVRPDGLLSVKIWRRRLADVISRGGRTNETRLAKEADGAGEIRHR